MAIAAESVRTLRTALHFGLAGRESKAIVVTSPSPGDGKSTIASNLAKNELRNRSRNPLVLFQAIKQNWDADHRPLEWEDNTYRPDDLFRKRHLKETVERAVKDLPEHHRVVFVLREVEGKTYEEIAEITGVNLGTVKSRLHRARTSFAELIEPLLN
jgi:RNA polymerase sigma-70 factor (ECF subfamily)